MADGLRAGKSSGGLRTILTAHVGTCCSCRSDVALAERLGGEMLARGNVSRSVRGFGDMDGLPDMDPDVHVQHSRAVDVGSNGGFDFFVQTCLKYSSDSFRWRRLGGGLQICRLTEQDNIKMWLLKARPGQVLPQHTHEGSELTLVLKGAYFCGEDLFKVGDIEDADETTSHQPMVTGNEDCICLAATEGSLRFDSLIARIAQKIVGI